MNNSPLRKINISSIFVKFILAIGALVFLSIYFAQLFPLDSLITSIWGTENAAYPTLALMAGAWAVCFVIIALIRVQSRLSREYLAFLSVLLGFLLVAVQIIIIIRYDYVGNYDAAITRYQSFDLHNGATQWPDYFYYYTNTVGFVSFMKRVLDFGQSISWLGLSPANFTELFQFILVDLGLFGIFWTIRRRSLASGNIFLVFALIFQPLYTNSFEFYSDSFAMVLPALFVFFNDQIFNSRKNWIRYTAILLLIILLGFAFFIKQNLIVLLIAEIIIVLLFWKRLRDFERAALAVGVVTSFFIFSVTFSSWKNTDNYLKNQNRAFPAYTWMALGYNVETKGQFSQSDFFSYDSIDNADEKTKYARDLLASRLHGLGPSGIFKQQVTKFRVMWSDATFDSLRYQNSFIGPLPQYDENPPQTDVRIRNFDQMIMLAVTLMSFLAFIRTLIKRKDQTSEHDQFLLMIFVLPILGITAFHVLVWEVESRYVTSLIPILLGIGSLSASMIYSGLENRLVKSPKASSRFILALLSMTFLLNLWSAISLPNTIKLKNSGGVINTTASLPNGVRDYIGKSSALFGKNYLLHYLPLEPGDSIIQEVATSVDSNQIWFSELPDGVKPSVIVDDREWDLTILSNQTYNFKMPAGTYGIRLTNNNQTAVKLPALYAPYAIGALPIDIENNPTLAIVTYNNTKDILKDLRPARSIYFIFLVGLACCFYLFSKNYRGKRLSDSYQVIDDFKKPTINQLPASKVKTDKPNTRSQRYNNDR